MKSKKISVGGRIVESLRQLHDATVSGDYSKVTVRHVHSPEPPRPFKPQDVKALRFSLGLSHALFAQVVAVSPMLVRAWEQGQRKPSPLACRLLEEVAARPEYWRSKVRAA